MYTKYIYLLPLLILCLPNSAESQKLCQFTAHVFRILLNGGFHRKLLYKINFQTTQDIISPIDFDGCTLSLQETFPAGIFVNPDELNELHRAGKLTAFPTSGVNVELLAEYAQPLTVYSFMQVSDKKANISLPLHARYHLAVKGGGSVKMELGHPRIFLRCPDNRLDECDLPITAKTHLCENYPDRCPWNEISSKVYKHWEVNWSVPVGNLNHFYIAAAWVIVNVVGGSVFILKKIHENKMACRRKDKS